MRHFQFYLILFLIFISYQSEAQILPSYGDSRTATTGWQFLKLNPDARAAGMNESFLAVVNDASGLFWNAAALTQLDTNAFHFTLAHTDYFAETNLEYAGVAYRINDNTLVGMSLQYFDSGVMDVTTEFLPFGNGQTFRATDLGFGISLARELTDQFSFGITSKYIREDIASVFMQNIVFDFGFQYDIGIANTRFAVALQNFGFNSSPSGEIHTTLLSGDTIFTTFNEVAVPTIFRLGFAWDAIKNEKNKLTTSAQLNHPTDNNETYSVGIEYGWKEILFARTGYTFSTDLFSIPSLGFGLQLQKYFGVVRLDYAFSDQSALGSIHRITFGLTL